MDIVTYALLNGKIKDYASNVDEWLEENVDPDTGYVLDRSLQMENAAAPADMVGDINDEVGDLKNTLNQLNDDLAPLKLAGTNTSGATIIPGTFFYNNDILVQSTTFINSNASITNQNTITAGSVGALNVLCNAIKKMTFTCDSNGNSAISFNRRDNFYPIRCVVKHSGDWELFNGWSIKPIYSTSGTFVGTSNCANTEVELTYIEL